MTTIFSAPICFKFNVFLLAYNIISLYTYSKTSFNNYITLQDITVKHKYNI